MTRHHNVVDAVQTARLLDRFLPLLSDTVCERFEDACDGDIMASDGYEAQLLRMLDRVVDDCDERRMGTIEIIGEEEYAAERWLRSVRSAIVHIVPETCERCNGSGEIARRTTTGSYVCAGPVPDYARDVAASRCDECNGSGVVG